MQPMEVQQFLMRAKQKKQNNLEKDFAIEVHHLLMKTYGWIPIKEFEKLPIPAILNLVDKIIRDAEEQKKASEKGFNKGRPKTLGKRSR